MTFWKPRIIFCSFALLMKIKKLSRWGKCMKSTLNTYFVSVKVKTLQWNLTQLLTKTCCTRLLILNPEIKADIHSTTISSVQSSNWKLHSSKVGSKDKTLICFCFLIPKRDEKEKKCWLISITNPWINRHKGL